MFLQTTGLGTAYVHELAISPVIKYVSAPTSPAASASASPTYRTLVKTDGHGNRWELPPLATVKLESIENAGGPHHSTVDHSPGLMPHAAGHS